jgi:hypothetical protein
MYPTFHIILRRVTSRPDRQQDQALSLARFSEFTKAGVTAATVSRMKEKVSSSNFAATFISYPTPRST